MDGFENLLRAYLAASFNSSEENDHLDEDMINALIEKRLSQKEQKPILEHLMNCAFCRHLTAQIIRLDFNLLEETPLLETTPSFSERITQFLSNLLQPSLAPIEAFGEKKEEEEKEKK
ncbi:MAG: hypothetical protein N2Z23_02180 [Pyrinomonadaceae bacterium]|nr:hypothetical protein [Pyrinomonadaceae bacterium]MCX7639238.1 hypothetical protein [Pyrinomonadaceae bacterium]